MLNIIDSILCLKYIFIHKYYVLKFGLKLKAPIWNLIIHDLSKLSLIEFRWHVHKNNERIKRNNFKIKDNCACLFHLKRGFHHWNSWIFIEDGGVIEAIEMPEKYIREMIADWLSAGYSKHKIIDIMDWYFINKKNIIFHPNTEKKVEELLKKLDFTNETVKMKI